VFDVLPPVVNTEQVRGLDVAKLPASAVVDAIVRGLERDRYEIQVGRVRELAVLARVAPRVADRIVARALTPET
jgi:short-subunit dehydrogenase involved in D-alanine esterification of teichoic acids